MRPHAPTMCPAQSKVLPGSSGLGESALVKWHLHPFLQRSLRKVKPCAQGPMAREGRGREGGELQVAETPAFTPQGSLRPNGVY